MGVFLKRSPYRINEKGQHQSKEEEEFESFLAAVTGEEEEESTLINLNRKVQLEMPK